MRSGRREDWLVFEGPDNGVNAWLRTKEASKDGSPYPVRANDIRAPATTPLDVRQPAVEAVVCSSSSAAESVPPSRIGHTSERADEAASNKIPVPAPSRPETPDKVSLLADVKSNRSTKNTKPAPLRLERVPSRRFRSNSSPPSAPLPPITLHLVPTLPETQTGGDQALRTAVVKGEKQRKRGFLKGFLGSKRKLEGLEHPSAPPALSSVQSATDAHQVERETSSKAATASGSHPRSRREETRPQDASETRDGPWGTARKRMAGVAEGNPSRINRSDSFLRPLRLMGTKGPANLEQSTASPRVVHEKPADPTAAPDVQHAGAASAERDNGVTKSSGRMTTPSADKTDGADRNMSMGLTAAGKELHVDKEPKRAHETIRPSSEAELERRLAEAQRHAEQQGAPRLNASAYPVRTKFVPRHIDSGDPVAVTDSMIDPPSEGTDGADTGERASFEAGPETPPDGNESEARDSSEDDKDASSSIPSDEEDSEMSPTPLNSHGPSSFLGKTFDGLPFGPDVPAVSQDGSTTQKKSAEATVCPAGVAGGSMAAAHCGADSCPCAGLCGSSKRIVSPLLAPDRHIWRRVPRGTRTQHACSVMCPQSSPSR